MIADLYTQITPSNHDQILEHVTSLEEYSPGKGYSLFQIGRYVNIFVLDDNCTYWTIYETCSHTRVCASFDELLIQLFMILLEN